jgi:hypothetical protein
MEDLKRVARNTCGINNLFILVSALEKDAMIAQRSRLPINKQTPAYVPTGKKSKNPGSKTQIVDMAGWRTY